MPHVSAQTCYGPRVAPRHSGSMHVAKLVSRQGGREYVSHLVRQSYREDGKVKHRTLANLSPLPQAAIDAVRRVLQGDQAVAKCCGCRTGDRLHDLTRCSCATG
jgi:hypothetical protein